MLMFKEPEIKGMQNRIQISVNLTELQINNITTVKGMRKERNNLI